MTRPVVFRQIAYLELNRAVIWYEERRQGLGIEFLTAFKASIAQIKERPESFPVEYRGFRKVLLDRFPYKIYFSIDHEKISVVGVLHGSQRTTRLRGRN